MRQPRLMGVVERHLVRAFETGRILPFLLVTMTSLVVAFAVVMRIFDKEDFPTLGLAMWWAVSTVTTVGYGDVVPHEPHGRILAAFLMLMGFGFLSLLTGTIASALVARMQARTDSTEKELLAALERVELRLDVLERRLPAGRDGP